MGWGYKAHPQMKGKEGRVVQGAQVCMWVWMIGGVTRWQVEASLLQFGFQECPGH